MMHVPKMLRVFTRTYNVASTCVTASTYDVTSTYNVASTSSNTMLHFKKRTQKEQKKTERNNKKNLK